MAKICRACCYVENAELPHGCTDPESCECGGVHAFAQGCGESWSVNRRDIEDVKVAGDIL